MVKSYWFATIQISKDHLLNLTFWSRYSIWEMEVISKAVELNSGKQPKPYNFSILFIMQLTREQYDENLKINSNEKITI